MRICYSFCLTEFLPMFGESVSYERGKKQVSPPITEEENARYSPFHLPLQLRHDQ